MQDRIGQCSADCQREGCVLFEVRAGAGCVGGGHCESGSGESKKVEEGDKVREVIGGQSTQPLKAEEVFGCYFE